MYSNLPNLVLAFHGCDRKTANAVLHEGKELKPSTNDYDWLGSGAYFWEQNLERANAWAKEQQKRGQIDDPAVIGAVIDFGHCLNLMDSEFIGLLQEEYKLYRLQMETSGHAMPSNEGSTKDKLFRRLDCAIINHLHARIDWEWKAAQADGDSEALQPFDSVRGLFTEGKPIYPGAGFCEKTHVQICVRNPNCIKGFFDPRRPSSKWPMP